MLSLEAMGYGVLVGTLASLVVILFDKLVVRRPRAVPARGTFVVVVDKPALEEAGFARLRGDRCYVVACSRRDSDNSGKHAVYATTVYDAEDVFAAPSVRTALLSDAEVSNLVAGGHRQWICPERQREGVPP